MDMPSDGAPEEQEVVVASPRQWEKVISSFLLDSVPFVRLENIRHRIARRVIYMRRYDRNERPTEAKVLLQRGRAADEERRLN